MDELRIPICICDQPESPSDDNTQQPFPGSLDKFNRLKGGNQSNVMIKKMDGHGAGKYLYLQENKQLDLTNCTNDKNITQLNWSVKPKRQFGKLGFSIMLFDCFNRDDSYLSLVVHKESNLVILRNGSYQEDMDNFWHIVPIRKRGDQNWQNTNFTTFQIVDMKTNKPLAARWCTEVGSYFIECGKVRRIGHTVCHEWALSDREVNTLWGFENNVSVNTLTSPGRKIFSKLHGQSMHGSYSLGCTNLVEMYLSRDAEGGVLLDSYGRNTTWLVQPWKERGKSGVLFSIWLWVCRFQLAVDTDGESVILSEGVMSDTGFQDNKWGLVPVEEREGGRGVYIIRKCMGNNAGAKLAVENNSGKIVCINSQDSRYSCHWIFDKHT